VANTRLAACRRIQPVRQTVLDRIDRLVQQGLLDWSRACLDSVSVGAKKMTCGGTPQLSAPWVRQLLWSLRRPRCGS
jgi:hypothetical protein